jgi:hypothetical protein
MGARTRTHIFECSAMSILRLARIVARRQSHQCNNTFHTAPSIYCDHQLTGAMNPPPYCPPPPPPLAACDAPMVAAMRSCDSPDETKLYFSFSSTFC